MLTQRNAWHLRLEDQTALVIAQTQAIEYLSQVDAVVVPDCHPRSGQVVYWRNNIVPVLGTLNQCPSIEHLLIIAFNDATLEYPAYMALALQSPPTAITVHDSEQCAPSATQQAYWGDALCCCIKSHDEILPIVDFSHLH